VKRFLQILSALAILSLLLVGAPPPAAHASTIWTVESTEDGAANASNCPGVNCRLRDAIAASVSGDTVNFSVTGTITLGGPLVIGHNLSISGPGAGLLTVDGNSLGRIFTTAGSTVVSISGLTLTHGLVDDTTTADYLEGGAIYVGPNSHLTLGQMVIQYNTVDCAGPCGAGEGFGGGIASVLNSSLTIDDSSISFNSATAIGGGIYFSSGTAAGDDLSLTNVTLMSNNVTDASVGDGGAIFIATAHQATLTNLTVSNNTAAFAGGGLYVTGAPVSITDSTFSSNQAQGTGSMSGGGAINVRDSASLRLANSSINSNSTASDGGGVWVSGVVAVIYNSTFVSNSAAGTNGGGGVFEGTADLTLVNNTMSGNMASSALGGGLYLNGGTVSLRNMIVANSGGSDCRSHLATWAANVSNLIETNDGSWPCNTPAFTSDPTLGPLADNGGPTKTMRLPRGSPAIDHGDNSSCANAGTVDNKDQRGLRRPVDGDHNGSIVCDIGAFERQLHTAPTDFDGDDKSDMGYFNGASGVWGILQSSHGFSYSSPLFFSWGQTGDIVAPGDYDGDGLLDPTVRRPPGGGQSAAYLMLFSSNGYDYGCALIIPAGWPGLGDTPVVGDYNGDGISDPAIWRGSAGVWIIPMSPAFNTYQFFSWGLTGDTPVGADVDGDGQTDIGYWRPSTGVWGFLKSTANYSYASPQWFNWGTTGDIPVMADYDGDGKADPAVVIPPSGGQSKAYRILLSTLAYNSSLSVTIPAGWPGLGDTPVPQDYDGDGEADAGIWRANSGVWIIPKSTTNNTAYMFAAWGASGDQVIR
jgi:hypothetical protein